MQLAVSTAIVLPVGLIYGWDPATLMPVVFGFAVDSVELKNMLRAIMGLYVALSALWTIGMVYAKFWRMATVTNVFFMGGLAFGRAISTLADGLSPQFMVALVVEVILMVWGIYNLYYLYDRRIV